MLGSQILEVALGITFVYLLLSLICSTITELLARVVGYRSGTLKIALRHLLEEGISKDALKSFGVDQLYAHPMIKSLSMPGRVDNRFRGGKGRPSYIPADRFATAVFDSIISAGKLTRPLTLSQEESDALDAAAIKLAGKDQKSAALLNEIKSNYAAGSLKQITGDQVRALEKAVGVSGDAQKRVLEAFKYKALRGAQPYTLSAAEMQAIDGAIVALTPGSPALAQYLEKLKRNPVLGASDLRTQAATTFQQWQDGLSELEDIPFKNALQELLDSARNEADTWDEAVVAARSNVEQWFDDYMDRVNGWYKRKVQVIILVLAFFIAFVGNVDTIAIGRALWTDVTLREAVAGQATTFVVRPQEAAPDGTETTPAAPTVAELQQQIHDLGLPIGWYSQNDNKNTLWDNFYIELPASSDATPAEREAAEARLKELSARGQKLDEVGARWPLKIAGMLLTALAVSLGAPFWFDLLGKLVNMRATGKPVELENGDKPEDNGPP